MFWTNLKAAIAAAIKTNNNQEITGAVLQSTLNSIVNSVGANATFAGVATPSTNPGTPDGPVFYITSQGGQYTNFGNQTVTVETATLGIFLWDGSDWSYSPVTIPDVASAKDLSSINASMVLLDILSSASFVSGNFKIAEIPVELSEGQTIVVATTASNYQDIYGYDSNNNFKSLGTFNSGSNGNILEIPITQSFVKIRIVGSSEYDDFAISLKIKDESLELESINISLDSLNVKRSASFVSGNFKIAEIPVELSEGQTIVVATTASNYQEIYGYDSNNNFKSLGIFNSGSNGNILEIPITQSFVKIRVAGSSEYDNFAISLKIKDEETESLELESINISLDSLNVKRSASFVSGNFKITEIPVELSEGQTIVIATTASNYQDIYGYDSNSFKSLGTFNSGSNGNILEIPITQSFVKIRVAGSSEYDDFAISLKIKDEESAKRDFDFLKSTAKSAICIGDSTTHGFICDYPDNKGYRWDTEDVSWPLFFSRLTGWTMLNAGHSGWNTTEWFNTWFENYNYSDFDIAFIEMGFNGTFDDELPALYETSPQWISGNSYEIGDFVKYKKVLYECETSNSDTDFNKEKWSVVALDTDSYPNNNISNYCKIIEGMLSRNENLFIILVISSTLNLVRQVKIRDIAARYNLPVIDCNDTTYINLSEDKLHGYREDTYPNTIDYVHFSPLGYAYKAEFIRKYTMDILNSNASYKQNTTLRLVKKLDDTYNRVYRPTD